MIDEDREAVRRVQAGDTEAFEILVEKYKRKAFRLAFQVLRDQEEALDVAQEAFVRAFRALPRFKGDSAFYTWLFRITMNLALDRRRQRAARARSLGAEDVPPEEWERTTASTDPGPAEVATGAERRERIARALGSLSEHHRSIIILSDIEGLAYREIADVLGIPMGTVMSRLHHARRRLREALGPGFASIVALVALAAALAGPAGAQGLAPSPLPPPGMLPPPAAGLPGMPAASVCVYTLVVLASGPLGGPGGAPLPPALARRPGPPAPGLAAPARDPDEDAGGAGAGSGSALEGGCGQPLRLRLWVPRLREVFGYASYEPVSAFEMTMPLGVAQRFALPGGREMEIQPLAVRAAVVRMLVRIKRGPVGELATVMDVPARRPVLIGGPPHDSGVLIIAIRSRPEP